MNTYDFTIKIAKEAGELLLSLREKGFKVMSKGFDSRDVVTSVDREVNKFIIDKIKKEFPTYGIYSEEGGGESGENDYQWIIDPIDGSANFSRGIPHFAVCLGLLDKNIPIVGAVYNPVTKELFSFKKGSGAFLNEKPIKVSSVNKLKDAHVFFHAGRKEELRNWGGESYGKLLKSAKKTSNLASSSLDTCFVASGRIEANIYGTLSTLDISPALGILTEVGGVVTNGSGEVPNLSNQPQKIFMANNKKTLKELLDLL
jgi:myo-inositol-1(or 4)-monophosphatase